MTLNYFGMMYYLSGFRGGIRFHLRSSRVVFRLMAIANVGVAILLIFNVLNIGFHREYGPYFVSLIFPLIVAGYMFMRMLLRPLWRSVRKNEISAE